MSAPRSRTAARTRPSRPDASSGWLLSPALARLAACGAGLMLVLPVQLPAQSVAQSKTPPRAVARAAAVRATTTTTAPAPVAPTAARDLPRGHTLTADDVTPATPALVGWMTRRVITAGEPLREPGIARPLAASAVTSGQRVAVLYRDAGVELRLAGVAANAAPIGGRVQVRLDARRRLEGTVVAPGVVQLSR